jgi:hypothetical protein
LRAIYSCETTQGGLIEMCANGRTGCLDRGAEQRQADAEGAPIFRYALWRRRLFL